MTYEIYRVEWHSDAHLEYLENQYRVGEPTGTLYGRDTETTRSLVRCNPIKTEKLSDDISFTWNDDKDNIFSSFTYETMKNLECGDWICLYDPNDKVDVFVGVIARKQHSDLYKYLYIGYDVGYYFEKNTLTKQFKNPQTVFNAICNVAEEIQVGLGDIADVKVIVDGIYRKQTASSILKDLYELAQNGYIKDNNNDQFNANKDHIVEDVYYFDCKNGKLNFFKPKDASKDLKWYINNYSEQDSFKYINDFNISTSMEGLRNSVKVYSTQTTYNTDEEPVLMAKKTSPESISKYGYLNHVEEVKVLDIQTKKGGNKQILEKQRYEEIAINLLDNLNSLSTTITLDVIGDYRMQKGVKFYMEDNKLGINAICQITKSEHRIEGNTERVKLNIDIIKTIKAN